MGDYPTLDFVILADRAEALNGKLYMMGGGWETIYIRSIEEAISFSLALGILVPWNATNNDHALAVRLEDADAKEILTLQTAFNAGRPPILRQGATQRIMLALPFSIVLPPHAAYVIVASVGGDSRRVSFNVEMATTPPWALGGAGHLPNIS